MNDKCIRDCKRRCQEEEIRRLERIICDMEKLLEAAKKALCDLKCC